MSHRTTSLREWLTIVILSISTNRTTIVFRNTSSFVPVGANRTLLWEIYTLYSIVILPWLAFEFRTRTYALSAIVVGTWWTGNINATISIPSLVRWACWITTSMLRRKPNKPRLTFTFIIQRIIYFITLTFCYLDAYLPIEPHSIRAHTGVYGRVPDLSTLT